LIDGTLNVLPWWCCPALLFLAVLPTLQQHRQLTGFQQIYLNMLKIGAALAVRPWGGTGCYERRQFEAEDGAAFSRCQKAL